jgi:hypothetical protein
VLIDGVDYEIDWRHFLKGTALFIPCFDARAAKAAVREEIKGKGAKVVMSYRVEHGIRGLRIWRI